MISFYHKSNYTNDAVLAKLDTLKFILFLVTGKNDSTTTN